MSAPQYRSVAPVSAQPSAHLCVLKAARVLLHHAAQAVEEEEKHGALSFVAVIGHGSEMPAALPKAIPHGQPFLGHKHTEAFVCAKIWVQKHLYKGRQDAVAIARCVPCARHVSAHAWPGARRSAHQE